MSLQLALPETPLVVLPVRDQLLENLVTLRQEWEDAASEDSLLDISASVGLMLLDIATRLSLTPAERALFLGERLEQEAAVILEDRQS
jgi:hypothetical protein